MMLGKMEGNGGRPKSALTQTEYGIKFYDTSIDKLF